MRFTSTKIKFNGMTPKEVLGVGSSYNGDIWFGTTENDMYKEELSGTRELISEKIPGRDQPYFYKVDHGVLEFNMILAFEDSIKESELKTIIDWLFRDDYAKLEFGASTNDEFQSRYFNVIFTNKPLVKYVITRDINGNDVVTGYLKLHAKCNSSTGFEENAGNPLTVETTTDATTGEVIATSASFTLNNTNGSLPLIYHMELHGRGEEITIDVLDETSTVVNTISYGVQPENTYLTIKSDIKSIVSSEGRNVYETWNPREFIIVNKGESKEITISGIDHTSDNIVKLYRPVYL